jgi:signal transduction histidine kinase
LRLLVSVGTVLRNVLVFPATERADPAAALAAFGAPLLYALVALFAETLPGGLAAPGRRRVPTIAADVVVDLLFVTLFYVHAGAGASGYFLLYLLPAMTVAEYSGPRGAVVSICIVAGTLSAAAVVVALTGVPSVTPLLSIGFRTIAVGLASWVAWRWAYGRRVRERVLRGVLRSLGCGLTVLSPDRKVIYVNHREKMHAPHYRPGTDQTCYHAFNSPRQGAKCSWCQLEEALGGKVAAAVTHSPAPESDRLMQDYLVVWSPLRMVDDAVAPPLGVLECIFRVDGLLVKEDWLNQANIGVALVGTDYVVQRMNAWKAARSRSDVKLGTDKCHDVFNVHPSPRCLQPCDECPVSMAVEAREPRTAITSAVEPSGHTRQALVTAVPVPHWRQGHFWGAAEFITDVTDLCQLSEMARELAYASDAGLGYVQEILDAAVRRLGLLFRADRCVVLEHNGRAQRALLKAEWSLTSSPCPPEAEAAGNEVHPATEWGGRRRAIPTDEGPAFADLIGHREVVALQGAEEVAGKLGRRTASLLARRGIELTSLLLAPIEVQGRVWGFAAVEMLSEAQDRAREFTAREKKALQGAAGLLGLAISRWNLRQTWEPRIPDLVHGIREPLEQFRASVRTSQDRESPVCERCLAAADMVEPVTDLIDAIGTLGSVLEPAELEREWVSVPDLLTSAVKGCASRAQASGITIESETAPSDPDPKVRANRKLVWLALQALLDNAIRHTEKGAVVVGVRPHHKGARLYVRNPGQGFAVEDASRLDRGFRVERRPGSRPGLGMGCLLVLRIVQTHGWEVHWVPRPEVDTPETYVVQIDVPKGDVSW